VKRPLSTIASPFAPQITASENGPLSSLISTYQPSTTSALEIKVTPPTPQFAPSAFTGQTPLASPSTSVNQQPTISSNSNSASAKTVTASSQAVIAKSAATSTPKPSVSNDLNTTTGLAAVTKKPSKQDLVNGFATWFFKGDHGLMEEFESFMVEKLVKETYDKYVEEQQESRRKEEEEKALAEANKFRIYSLSVKYFYRWKDNARNKFLSRTRRAGRDKVRVYYEAQRIATLKAKEKAAKMALARATRSTMRRPSSASVDSVDEFRDLLKVQRKSIQKAEDELLATGVLSGLADERQAAADIVREANARAAVADQSQSKSRFLGKLKSGFSQSISLAKSTGAKTQALRNEFSRSTNFRRSLPPMSSSPKFTPEPESKRTSKVSDRWRLKAMGLVTMPDGSALPESIANAMKYEGKRYPGLGSFGLPSVSRRVTSSGADQVPNGILSHSKSHSISIAQTIEGSPTNKRKRPFESSGAINGLDGSNEPTSKKRVGGDDYDTAAMIDELRRLREEMEDGVSWFREQNEMMQNELTSRVSSPWEKSI
jgi:nuclear mRNA export protein SAC3